MRSNEINVRRDVYFRHLTVIQNFLFRKSLPATISISADKIPCSPAETPCSTKIIPCFIE